VSTGSVRAVVVGALALLSACTDVTAVTIVIHPPSATTIVGQTAKFDCSVTQSSSGSVKIDGNRTASSWKVDEGDPGGTLAADTMSSLYMIYTAPVSVGTFHVRCTATADSGISDAAIVTVMAP
jgi:hypothetical protein